MKRLFLIFAIIMSNIVMVMSQSYPCDLASTGVELRNSTGGIIVSNIPVGGTGILRLKVMNAGSGIGTCNYQIGEVKVYAYFADPSSSSYFYKYDGPATFSTAKYTWTYDAPNSTLMGINNVNIVAGLGGIETVDIPIAGVAAGAFELTIEGEVFASASSDNTLNNTWPANVTVVAPQSLPLTITDYSGFSVNCDATLKWATSFESNLSRFEIEQSSNGTIFNKVGTVQGLNQVNGGSYQFNYSQGTGNFYYRLKMIDKDGSFVYSKIITIQSNCNGKKIVKLYPNPVITNQLLNLNIEGYSRNIKADLYSATGQLVKSFNVKNGSNTLPLDRIAQGLYTLKISEEGTLTETFKVNVIQ